jgi:hypothetical protein
MDFRPERDAGHPVRWEPAQADEPDKWLSMEDAVERLTRNGQGDPTTTERTLRNGTPLWTAFATYRYEPPTITDEVVRLIDEQDARVVASKSQDPA